MRILCVVVVLSLISVVWSAPLACESLLKPPVKTPDNISGEWFLISFGTESCWFSTLFKLFFGGSISYYITPLNQLNTYETRTNVKWFGYCVNETEIVSFVNNGFLDGGYVEGQGYPEGDPDILIQTDCPDCLVIKEKEDDRDYLVLLSRRQTVTASELAEFTKQAECLGWSAPVILNFDHDTTCKALDLDGDNFEFTDEDFQKIYDTFYERLYNTYDSIFDCILNTFKNLI